MITITWWQEPEAEKIWRELGVNLTSQDINDLMDVVGNRMDDLSDAGLAYTDDGDTDETKRLRKLYVKLKVLSEESEE